MTSQSNHKIRGLSPAADASTDRADDLLGAVVPLRAREAPATCEKNDLSNVIPFHPRQRLADKSADGKTAPAVVVEQEGRPAPLWAGFDLRRQWPFLLIGSVAVHACLFLWFMREPPPQASVGLEVISVEMVLGSNAEAGTATTPGETSVESAYSPDQENPDDTKTETAEQQVEQVVKEEPKPQFQLTPPPEPQPQAELGVDPKPEPKKEAVKPAPEKKKALEKGTAKRNRVAPSSQASVAANSIGRGRSDSDTNYRGMVIAHLSRHKQFPSEARSRGDQGVASVSFGVDGNGQVTSVRLARSSGSSSLDQEVQAMVRRASPFPAPPSGRAMSFTAPINFNLR